MHLCEKLHAFLENFALSLKTSCFPRKLLAFFIICALSCALPHPTRQVQIWKRCAKRSLLCICGGLSHPTQQVQIQKKGAIRPLPSALCCHTTQPSKFKFDKSAPKGHYYLQQAVTTDPASSNTKKMRHTAITICSRLSQPSKFKFEKSAPYGHYYLQQAVTPDPASLNSKKVRHPAITICSWL